MFVYLLIEQVLLIFAVSYREQAGIEYKRNVQVSGGDSNVIYAFSHYNSTSKISFLLRVFYHFSGFHLSCLCRLACRTFKSSSYICSYIQYNISILSSMGPKSCPLSRIFWASFELLILILNNEICSLNLDTKFSNLSVVPMGKAWAC